MAGINIPRYDEPQVKSVGIATPRAQGVSAAAFGAGLGAGISQAGEVGAVVVGDYQREEIQRKSYELRTGLDDLEQTTKYGDPGNNNVEGQDPTSFEGFLKIEGAESMQFRDSYLTDFKDRAMKLIPADVSPKVRAGMERLVNERYNSIAGEFNRHALAQESKANDAAAGAIEASIKRNISLYADDENRFQLELATLKHVVSEDVTRNYGEGGEAATAIRKSRIELAVNDAYSKRINSLILADPSKAQQFLTDNSGNGTFTPETVDHYKQVLKPLVANQDGLNIVFDKYIPRLKAGEPVDALIAEAQKGLTTRPEVFKVVEAQLRASENDIHNGRVQAAQTAAMPVQKLMIERGYNLTPAELLNSSDYRKLIAIGTPEALAIADKYSNDVLREFRMKQADLRTAAREDRLERKYDAAQAKQESDQAAQLEFTRLSLNPDIVAGMSQFEIQEKQRELGKVYGGQLLRLKKDLSSPEKLATVKLENKSFVSLMGQLGVTGKNKQAQYYTAVQDYLVAQQKEGQRIFNPEQIRKAVVGAFQEVEVSYRTKDYFGDGYSYGTEKKRRIDVTNPASIVIPQKDLKEVTDFLSKYNFPDTPDNRLKAYDQLLIDRGTEKLNKKR